MAATQTRGKKPQTVNPSTAAVNRFRERMAAKGEATLYCVVDLETQEALETIMHRKLCDKREAVKLALIRYAADVSRKR